MPCYHPLTAWKPRDFGEYNTKSGKAKLVFNRDQGLKSTQLELPCGQCIGCRLDRARDWAARCVHEAKLYPENCFITLTYGENNEPENGSLNKRDIQLFLKRLRKKHSDITIRFFQCGEYGEKGNRPHHHVLLFNFNFPDRIPFTRQGENQLYISPELSELWPYGFHSIGELNYDTACYTARYLLKKVTGKSSEAHYQGRLPEYTTMSRKPGLGHAWYLQFKNDVYAQDRLVIHHNFICRPPAYYDRLYDIECPKRFSEIKKQRCLKAKELNTDSDDRRSQREAHAAACIKQKAQRNYEKA